MKFKRGSAEGFGGLPPGSFFLMTPISCMVSGELGPLAKSARGEVGPLAKLARAKSARKLYDMLG